MLSNDHRRNLFRSLDSIPAEAATRLAALGITTLEELRDHWTYGNRERIIDYLGESPLRFVSASPERFLATRGAAGSPSNVVNLLDTGRARPLVKRSRGVLLSLAERQSKATGVETPPSLLASRRPTASTKSVSLVAKFPAVRNQQDRGTCVAFSPNCLTRISSERSGGRDGQATLGAVRLLGLQTGRPPAARRRDFRQHGA